jgi:hypothetical protein
LFACDGLCCIGLQEEPVLFAFTGGSANYQFINAALYDRTLNSTFRLLNCMVNAVQEERVLFAFTGSSAGQFKTWP